MAMLSNDHITLDCPIMAMSVCRVVGDWFAVQMRTVDRRASDGFSEAWAWQLVPARRKPWTLLAIMLAAIAKHQIWITFTAIVFGTWLLMIHLVWILVRRRWQNGLSTVL